MSANVEPGAFNAAGGLGDPTESAWIVIDGRRYKVLAVPRRTPTFVVEWCSGGLIMGLVGLAIVHFANRGDSVWAARVYWQKKRWYNGRYRWLLQEEFDDEDAAKARAAELIETLRAGAVPASS